MATPFDDLPLFAFNGIPFRAVSYSMRGGMREVTHERPYQPGGIEELLGRRLYTIDVEAAFVVGQKPFLSAWPDDLDALRTSFEAGTKADLEIPTVGTLQAYAVDWTVDARASFRNGENAKFTFKEVSDDAFSNATPRHVTTTIEGVASFYHDLVVIAHEQQMSEEALDFFESIGAIVDELQAYKGRVDMATASIVGKIDGLIRACQQADVLLEELNDPPHFKVLEALQELTVAAIDTQKNIVRAVGPTRLFVVPALMTVQQVATMVYGDTKRAMDILKLNPIEDALAIPAGVELKIAA